MTNRLMDIYNHFIVIDDVFFLNPVEEERVDIFILDYFSLINKDIM